MRVTLKTEGGNMPIPKEKQFVTFDTDALPPEQADELRRRVAAADFFNQPAEPPPPPPGAADYRTYTLTVEDGYRTHTVRLTDLTHNPPLRILSTFVQGLRPSPGAP